MNAACLPGIIMMKKKQRIIILRNYDWFDRFILVEFYGISTIVGHSMPM